MKRRPGAWVVWVGNELTNRRTNPNYGKVFRLVRYVGTVVGMPANDRWLVEGDKMQVMKGTNKGLLHTTPRGASLRPITMIEAAAIKLGSPP